MSGSPLPPTLPPVYVKLFTDIIINADFQVAAAAILVFDYTLTFSDEVDFVWKQNPLNPFTVLFVAARYLPFVDTAFVLFETLGLNPSPTSCHRHAEAQAWLYAAGLIITEAIFIVRTYALFEKNMWLASALFALLAGVLIGCSIFVKLFLNSLNYILSPSPMHLTGCLLSQPNSRLWPVYLLLLLFESVILGLTLYKVIQQRRFTGTDSTLFKTFYRDGLMFYIYLFAISLINIVILNTAPAVFQNSLTALHRVLHAILAARLVINIRKSALKLRGVDTTMTQMASMKFEPGDSKAVVPQTDFETDSTPPVQSGTGEIEEIAETGATSS